MASRAEMVSGKLDTWNRARISSNWSGLTRVTWTSPGNSTVTGKGYLLQDSTHNLIRIRAYDSTVEILAYLRLDGTDVESVREQGVGLEIMFKSGALIKVVPDIDDKLQ
jgi:hypothetical protein